MLIVDVIIIVAVARLLGTLLTRIGQPAVIGEILAGIVLGPTLMGETLNAALFPADVRPVLSWLANAGVIIFLFFIGLELDRSLLQGQRRVVAAVAFGSLALPFALGVGLALLLPAHPTGNELAFILFMGTALSVTAFPVLARILTDRGMVHTRLGVLALTVAAVIDVVAWVLLAVVTAVVGTEASSEWRIALVVPYVALMVGVVRPLARCFAERCPRPGPAASACVLTGIGLGLAASAAATSWMGLHAIFGAFLFGWVMPRTGQPLLRERVLPERPLYGYRLVDAGPRPNRAPGGPQRTRPPQRRRWRRPRVGRGRTARRPGTTRGDPAGDRCLTAIPGTASSAAPHWPDRRWSE